MGFFRYVREAFNARPWGMWVAPNWVALAAFAMLGLLNPGFWIIGGGLELGYLLLLATSTRFRRVIDARENFAQKKDSEQQIAALLARLEPADQARYRQLQARCQSVLLQQHDVGPVDLQTQADGLGKLLYVYLRLLVTRNGILRVLEGASSRSIDLKIGEVKGQLQSAGTPELQRSLNDQLDILAERKKRHGEARQKLQFIEAELTRIQEQVELIREGLVVTTDPTALSHRIDTVGRTLAATSQWIRQQQELLGQTEELLDDAPPVALEVPRVAQG